MEVKLSLPPRTTVYLREAKELITTKPLEEKKTQ